MGDHLVLAITDQFRVLCAECLNVLEDLNEYWDVFRWKGAVLVATGNADSDSWRLGKELR